MRHLACFAFALIALGPSAAQSPVLAEQDSRLEAALAALPAQRPGTVDAYVIVAALDDDPVFNREAREAGKVLAKRFDAEQRTIVLGEDEGAERADASGTTHHLERAIARATGMMDGNEDVLILYTTSHGSPHEGLDVRHSVHGSDIISPERLKAMLAANGVQNRLVIIQACFSGQFLPALKGPRSVAVTAASSMTSSFGCSASNDWTFFGHALINQAMRKPDTLARQLRRAVVSIIGWEGKLGIAASNPQIDIGSETGAWLAALDAHAPAVPPNPVGSPPSELSRQEP